LTKVRHPTAASAIKTNNWIKEVLGMKNLTVLAAAMLLVSGYAAHAQDADIAAGQAYAEKVCAACHAVLANENMSPLAEAPTFQSVADTPGMTEMALTVWLQSSHPTMPNIILKPDDLRNVVAYIRSLDRKG
jgi:mono/diheme cytochrome c family protein